MLTPDFGTCSLQLRGADTAYLHTSVLVTTCHSPSRPLAHSRCSATCLLKCKARCSRSDFSKENKCVVEHSSAVENEAQLALLVFRNSSSWSSPVFGFALRSPGASGPAPSLVAILLSVQKMASKANRKARSSLAQRQA